MNIQQALARSQPADPGSKQSFSFEAQSLLAEITGRTRAWILAHPELDLTPDQEIQYHQQLLSLQEGTPLAYLLGRQEFFGRSFRVSRATLIPRPETELLIEQALVIGHSFPAGFTAADVGAGSGCIGITLACEVPAAYVVAVDPSLEALKVARDNAVDHQVIDRSLLIQGNLLDPVAGKFMLICANLPYIPSGNLETLDVIRYEPRLALDGGEDGMGYSRSLIHQLPRCLLPAGSALLEIDDGQAEELCQCAADCLPDREIRVLTDYSGFERVLIIGPGVH